MAHFAEINDSNVVLRVLVVEDKDTQDEDGNVVESVGAKFLSDTLGLGGTWKRTSMNTFGGVHSLGGTPFRKNPATIGGGYDEAKDAFYRAQPYPLWTLTEDTCQWESPIPYPDSEFDTSVDENGNEIKVPKPYEWDTVTENWISKVLPD